MEEKISMDFTPNEWSFLALAASIASGLAEAKKNETPKDAIDLALYIATKNCDNKTISDRINGKLLEILRNPSKEKSRKNKGILCFFAK